MGGTGSQKLDGQGSSPCVHHTHIKGKGGDRVLFLQKKGVGKVSFPCPNALSL